MVISKARSPGKKVRNHHSTRSGEFYLTMEEKKMLMPCCWLLPLLDAKFYSLCDSHRSKNTHFCLDCIGLLLCEGCLKAKQHPAAHQIIQVFKASRKVAIKIEDLHKHVDISCIQPYINNDSRIVYINQRRQKDELQPDSSSSVPKCESCGWKLLPGTTSIFCSIQCKINFEENSRKQPIKTKFERMLLKPINRSPHSFRRRSRKGIPIRSPFF